jgi:teichuronic acid exporter
MSLGNSIRHGATWLLLGSTSSQVLGMLFGIVLARLLVPEDFGLLATIQVFTGLVGFVAGGGMGQALVRSKEASHHDYNVVFTLQLIIGCFIYVLFFLLAPWFADWYQQPLYTSLLRISALSFIIRPFSNLPNNMLHREMRFKVQAIVGFVCLLVSNAVSIGMAYLGFGVWSLTIGGLSGSLVAMTMTIPITGWRPHLTLDLGKARDIARYGFLVTINDFIYYLRQQANIFILSRTLGAHSVGLYNKADSQARMPHGFITGSLYHVLFRALAKEQDNLDTSRYLFYRGISLVAVYTFPFYVGLYFVSTAFVITLFGAHWADSAPPLHILTLAAPFWLVENLSGALLAARNRLEKELIVQVAMLCIVSLVVLISLPYGLPGIAWGIVAASIYSATHMYWLAARSLRSRLLDLSRALTPAFILNALLFAALFLVDSQLPTDVRAKPALYLLIMVACGGLAYTVAFLFLPIPALADEAKRWKQRLRYPFVGAQTKPDNESV